MNSPQTPGLGRMAGAFCLAAIYFILCFPQVAQAQKKEKYKGIGFNKDKIELLYQNVSYTTTYSSGRSYSGTYKAPLLRINNAEPVDYDPYMLLPYFKECPAAKKEVNAYTLTRKRSKESFIKGFLLGGAVAVAGVIGAGVASQKNEKLALPIFGVSFGTGLGLVIHRFYKSRKLHKKSLGHLENSVVFYNQKCYQGAPINKPDTTQTVSAVSPEKISEVVKNNGVQDNYQDTFYYELLRNNPEKSSFWSGGLHLLDFDISNFHNLNYMVGADFFLQKTSKFSMEGMYRINLIDNFSEDSQKGSYVEEDDIIESGESADYKRAREISALATLEFAHKDKVKNESIYIGSKTLGGVAVSQYGKMDVKSRISYGARLGLIDFNAVWFTVNGLPFATSQQAPSITDPSTGEVYPQEYDLSNAIVMVHSTSVAAGISRRVVSDWKVEIFNPKKNKMRESVGFRELYADVTYAPRITTGEVYQINSNPFTGVENLITLKTDETDLNPIGFRAGFRTVDPGGLALGLEFGMRPGPNAYRGYLILTGQYRFGKSF
ncbi:MAG TPA: hypothetical protein DCF33_01170 [Saprospirales bacterium]|nr:hypothetical protein [Saprospirales bacterium]